jgi:beta-1,4-N-acetylglucosaminyltransferase
VVLCNGPGTCIPLCLLAYLLSLFSLLHCPVIFIESVCRVRGLSLSGLILYHSRVADAVVVQWPELTGKYPRAIYLGRI